MSPHEPPSYDEADPFDLPDWLGEEEVTWYAQGSLAAGHRVQGVLAATCHEPIPCDLLAVDDAYPEPAAADGLRVRVHQAWRHGEVTVAREGAGIILAVPGTRADADRALEAVARFARAVGAAPGTYAVSLRA